MRAGVEEKQLEGKQTALKVIGPGSVEHVDKLLALK